MLVTDKKFRFVVLFGVLMSCWDSQPALAVVKESLPLAGQDDRPFWVIGILLCICGIFLTIKYKK